MIGIRNDGELLNKIGLDAASAAREVAFEKATLDGKEVQVDDAIRISNMRPARGGDPIEPLVGALSPAGYAVLKTTAELSRMQSPIAFELTTNTRLLLRGALRCVRWGSE